MLVFNALYLFFWTVVSLTFLRLSSCKVGEDHERIMDEVQATAQATKLLCQLRAPGLQGFGFCGT